MAGYSKRAIFTLLPEWEPQLQQLKREKFYDKTRAEMFRYIISRGLDALQLEREASAYLKAQASAELEQAFKIEKNGG